MTTLRRQLAAIRERDRQAARCRICGTSLSGHRTDTLAECEVDRGGRPCGDPRVHHPFEAGEEYDDWNGEADRHFLIGLVDHYRQAFLDIAAQAGEDTSGIDHPDQLAFPPIEVYTLDAVKQLHRDYDECLSE